HVAALRASLRLSDVALGRRSPLLPHRPPPSSALCPYTTLFRSFCRNAADIEEARALIRSHGSDAAVCAKIERAEAIANLAGIINASDAVMVARGDLGVEIGDAELPGLQKKIIRESLACAKVVITATQMLQSMVDSPIPTRAEVLDVANAVIDGTDAVMLSQESAAGAYPLKAVEAMARICVGAEKQFVMDT